MMLKHQNLQKKAREEIDRVFTSDRLPTYEDLVNLPYCEALIKETLRIYPPVPLCAVLPLFCFY